MKSYIKSFLTTVLLTVGVFVSTSNAATQALTINSSGTVVNTNNSITFTSNVTAGKFIGDGSLLINLPSSSGGVTNQLLLNGKYYPAISGLSLFVDASVIPAGQYSNIVDQSGVSAGLSIPVTNSVVSVYAGGWFTNALVAASAINGRNALYFPQMWVNAGLPTAIYSLINTNLWQPPMNTNSSVTFVVENLNESDGSAYNVQPPILFSIGTNAAYGGQGMYYNLFRPYGVNASGECGADGVVWNNQTIYVQPQAGSLPYIVTINVSNNLVSAWMNGVCVSGLNQSPSASVNASDSYFALGVPITHSGIYNYQISPPNNYYVGALIVTSNTLPNSQIINLHQSLAQTFGIGGGAAILCFGDSVTSGLGASANTNVQSSFHRQSPAVNFYNLAKPGAKASDVLLQITNALISQPVGAITKIGFYMDGYNDIANSVSFATWTNNVALAGQLLVNRGIPWAIATLPDNAYETNSGNTISLVQINNFIRTNNVLNNRAIREWGMEPSFNTNGAWANPALTNLYFPYAPMFVHFTGNTYENFVKHWDVPVANYMLNSGAGAFANYTGGTNTLFTHNTNGVWSTPSSTP